jgi:hypothetical protein
MKQMKNSLYLRLALVASYCFIDITIIREIVGGFVFNVLIDLIVGKSIWLKLIAFLFFTCLLAWIFPVKGDNQKLVLIISSVILISPLLLNLFWQIGEKNIELGFLVPTIAFFSFLFLTWKEVLNP